MNPKSLSLVHLFTRALLGFLSILLLTACAGGSSATPTQVLPTWTIPPSRTRAPSQTAASTPVPTSTRTATRIATRTATYTPAPTATITPSPTATQDINPQAIATLGSGRLADWARSPDGKRIAIVDGKTLRWLDGASMQEIGSVDLGDSDGWGVQISPDNRWIIVKVGFGEHVVDMATRSVDRCCSGDTGGGYGFGFSSDSRYLVYRADNHTTGGPYDSVEVYDLEAHQNIETRTDRMIATESASDNFSFQDWNQSYPVLRPSRYHSMSYPTISPDDRWLAAGYQDTGDNLLYLWDVQTGEKRFAIPHPAQVNAVAFSPDGRYLASACDDGLVRLFNPLTGRLVRTLTGFLNSITDIHFSADSRRLEISVSHQPDLEYDLSTGQSAPPVTPQTTPDPFLVSKHMQGYADGSAVLFSPDGRTLALGGNSVQLWDIASEKVKLSLEAVTPNSTVGWAFSPDGNRFGQIDLNGNITIWDISTNSVLLRLTSAQMEASQVYAGRGIGVFIAEGIAFSPDSARLAFGNGNQIDIWDIVSDRRVIALEQPGALAFATRVSFSKDGKRLYAVINRNRDAQVWDAQTGKLIRQLDLPNVNPNVFDATALTGSLLARNNCDDSGCWIELWNLETETIFKLPTPSGETEPLLFSPDGSLLMSISQDDLYVWKTATGQLLYSNHVEYNMRLLAISPDNATLAIGQDGKAQLWDMTGIRQAALNPAVPPYPTPWDVSQNPTSTPPTTQAVIFPTSPALPEGALSSQNAAQIQELADFGRGVLDDILWAPANQAPTVTLVTAGSQGVFSFGASPLTETSRLLTGAWMQSVAQLENGEILAAGVLSQSVQVWNASTGQMLLSLPGVGPLRLSSDGKLLTYSDSDGNLYVFDLAARQPLSTLYTDYAARLPVFSPDNRLVAAVDGYESTLWAQHFVRIWDMHSGAIVNALGGPDAAITDLSFSQDGKFVVGAAGGSAWVWNLQAPAQPYTITLYTPEYDHNLTLYHQSVTAAALSADNRLLAIGDSERNVWLYDRLSRGLLRRLQGHTAPLARLRFSPDGSRLLSADQDGNLILWNLADGKIIDRLAAHTGPLRGLLLGLDGNLRAWEADTAWTLRPQDGTLVQSASVYSGTIFAASPAGDWLAVSNRLRMSVWDARTGAFIQLLEGEAGFPLIEYMYEGRVLPGFYAAFFSADGKQLTTLELSEIRDYKLQANNTFQLAAETDTSYLNFFDYQIERSASSPGGFLSATTAQRYEPAPTLVLNDQVGHEINRMLFPEKAQLTALAFSPDARLLAVGQADGSISLVDVASWKIIARLPGHKAAVSALAFSADGLRLVSAGDDGVIRFWGVK